MMRYVNAECQLVRTQQVLAIETGERSYKKHLSRPVSIETPVKKASHTVLSIHKGPWGKCGGFIEDTMVPQFPHVWQSWDLNSGRQAPELRFALASVSRSKEIVSGKTGDSPSLSMPWHDL